MKRLDTIRALLIEDSRPMRILVRDMLRALGITKCECAASADEAIEILSMFTPDLVITDLIMEGEDGIGLARRIRGWNDGAIARVPIVMMSGHSERSRVKAALDAGVNTFLVKPVSARALAHHVSFALNDGRGTLARYDNARESSRLAESIAG